MQTGWPAGMIQFDFAQELHDTITEMSGGRLVIKQFPSDALVPFGSEGDACRAGTLDGWDYSLDNDVGWLGRAALLTSNAPGLLVPEEHMAWTTVGGGADMIQGLYDARGGGEHVIGPKVIYGAEGFAWANKRLDSLEAFKGVKFRAGGIWGDILNTMGASVIYIGGGELYEALSRGVLDAFEYCDPATDYDMGFYEIAKYYVLPGIHSPCSDSYWVCNGDSWAELDPGLQKIVTEATAANTARLMYKIHYLDSLAMQKIRDYGTEIVMLPEDVQKEAVLKSRAFFEQEAAKDADFAKMYNSITSFLKTYREWELLQPQPKFLQ